MMIHDKPQSHLMVIRIAQVPLATVKLIWEKLWTNYVYNVTMDVNIV